MVSLGPIVDDEDVALYDLSLFDLATYSAVHLTGNSTEIGNGTRISDQGRFDKGSETLGTARSRGVPRVR